MRLRFLVTVLAALALAAAGCGDGDDSNGGGAGAGGSGNGGGGSTLALSADPGGALEFDKTSLKAKAGTVTITFDNPAQVPHAVEVEGNGVEEETDTITDGSAKLTVDLEPGEYEFYCPVGNHQEAGMEGTLTVR